MPERALPSGRSGATPDVGVAAGPRATACPACGQRFSPDARFCPFDGEALVAAKERAAGGDPLVGTTIDGRYTVESVLGEGGMGTVYRVRHRALDKGFALKVMRADVARDRDLAQRFIQEAKATAAIGHPNIVQITDFGELPGGAPYFVMELLDGQPLSRILRAGGPLPAGRAVRLIRQAAAALGAAHGAGIVHRDLKPDNVHVTSGEIVKILDFGVAKIAGASRLTRTGMVFGTPHYMSPEQASGQTVDHRADLYALGIIMYEMFTGRVPFEADTYMGVLTKHMFMAPEPPSKVCAAARELGALEDVTLRCLEKKPEARYASMAELVAEIESVVRLGADDSVELLRATRLSAAPSRRNLALADELEPPGVDEVRAARGYGVPVGPPRGLVVGGLVLAALVVGVVAWLVARPGPGGHPAALDARPPPAVAAAPATVVVTPPVLPAPAITVPPPSVAAAAAPPSASTAVSVAPPVVHVSAHARTHGTATAAPPVAKPSTAPSTVPSTFGGGEIVNPWAQ